MAVHTSSLTVVEELLSGTNGPSTTATADAAPANDHQAAGDAINDNTPDLSTTASANTT